MDDLDPLRGLGLDVPTGDAEAKDRARRRLRQRFTESVEPAARSKHRRGAARWILVAASIGAIATALTVLRDGSSARTPSASQTLRQLALVAARQPNLFPPPGKFVYVRSEQLRRVGGQDLETGGSWTALVRVTRQDWRAADGSGRILTVAGTRRFHTATDEAAWRRAGRPQLLPAVADERYPAGTYPTPTWPGFPWTPAPCARPSSTAP